MATRGDSRRIKRKAARLYNLYLGPETGRGADCRAYILGNIRLVESKTHSPVFTQLSGNVSGRLATPGRSVSIPRLYR